MATGWQSAHATRARLIAGGSAVRLRFDREAPRLLVGIEIELDDGWKTYWRNPGSSGVPPHFDWKGSENLAAAEALFPAPQRFKERDGDTIGYKKHVVLPVAIEAKDPTKPVALKLALEYGVCREVCVPALAVLELVLPPDLAGKASGKDLAAAVERVPAPRREKRSADPILAEWRAQLKGDKPEIWLAVVFPQAKTGDVFLEAPDGLWVPLARDHGERGPGKRLFHVDLTDGADIEALKNRSVRVTMVSEAGAKEGTIDLWWP